MDHSPYEFLKRFLFAIAGVSVAVAVASYQTPLFAAQLVPIGLLLAAMLTMVRMRWHAPALMLAALLGPARLIIDPFLRRMSDGLSTGPVWVEVLQAVTIGFGLLACSLVFASLADRGWRFFKFLILGGMIGILFVAHLPMDEMGSAVTTITKQELLVSFYLGVIVGDGAGFGAELYDLLFGQVAAPEPN